MIRWLLVVIFLAALPVPFFDRSSPALFGFPFFYWYQMAVILASAAVTFVVFIVEDKKGDAQ